MKIKKDISHVYNRYALDPWVCYHSNTLCDSIVNNGDKSLFNHLLKYRGSKYVHYISNYKIRNDVRDISKYKSKLFKQFSIYNISISGISLYFEDIHGFYKD